MKWSAFGYGVVFPTGSSRSWAERATIPSPTREPDPDNAGERDRHAQPSITSINAITFTTLSTNIIPIPRARRFPRVHKSCSLKSQKKRVSGTRTSAPAASPRKPSLQRPHVPRAHKSKRATRAGMAWEQRHTDGIRTSSATASRKRTTSPAG